MCDKLWKIWVFPCILVAISCFANLKVKGNKNRLLSDRLEVSTNKLSKNKRIIEYTLKFQAKSFRFQPRLNRHIFMKGCNILPLKICMTLININNAHVWVQKKRPDMVDMYYNNDSLFCFL